MGSLALCTRMHCRLKQFPINSGPAQGPVRQLQPQFLEVQVQGAVLILEILHIEALIAHELSSGLFKF